MQQLVHHPLFNHILSLHHTPHLKALISTPTTFILFQMQLTMDILELITSLFLPKCQVIHFLINLYPIHSIPLHSNLFLDLQNHPVAKS